MKANNVVPPGAGQLLDSCLALLSVKRIQIPPVVAGFDGFVDTILHAVSERRSATEYSRLLTLHAFSEKILAASGGRNTNIEMVQRLTKIGGNGPILANALAHFEIPVSYIGCLGSPELHPVFAEFARSIRTFSIAEPGYSDAIEFTDGKLICSLIKLATICPAHAKHFSLIRLILQRDPRRTFYASLKRSRG